MCVTGAAGQIAYSLLYSLANGDVFGKNQVKLQRSPIVDTASTSMTLSPFSHHHPPQHTQPLILTLLDITPMMGSLHGVVMELQDCALTLLKGGCPNNSLLLASEQV